MDMRNVDLMCCLPSVIREGHSLLLVWPYAQHSCDYARIAGRAYCTILYKLLSAVCDAERVLCAICSTELNWRGGERAGRARIGGIAVSLRLLGTRNLQSVVHAEIRCPVRCCGRWIVCACRGASNANTATQKTLTLFDYPMYNGRGTVLYCGMYTRCTVCRRVIVLTVGRDDDRVASFTDDAARLYSLLRPLYLITEDVSGRNCQKPLIHMYSCRPRATSANPRRLTPSNTRHVASSRDMLQGSCLLYCTIACYRLQDGSHDMS